MKFELIPKKPQPTLTFKDLHNGDVFKFKSINHTSFLYMKCPGSQAFRLSNPDHVVNGKDDDEVILFDSNLIVQELR